MKTYISFIIYGEIFEGVLTIVGVVILLGLFVGAFAGIFWIAEKYFGIKTIGRFSVREEISKSDNINSQLSQIQINDPELFEKAKAICKKKGYVLSNLNILAEATKLKNETQATDQEIQNRFRNDINEFERKRRINNITTVNEILNDPKITNEEKLKTLKLFKSLSYITDQQYNKIKVKLGG